MLHHVREEVSVKIEYIFVSPYAIVDQLPGRVGIEA
jgi:hypothetical protein